MQLWGGRFQKDNSVFFKRFNSSLPFDHVLIHHDINCSIHWSKAIQRAGVLTEHEQKKIEQALLELSSKVRNGEVNINTSDAEDVHSFVEAELIKKLGDIARKLHTGRSRNDQIATDLRLWAREQTDILIKTLKQCQYELITLAEHNQDVILPGYTHLQRAQPVRFAHWCLAYIEMFKRDTDRLEDARKRINQSPLGCGALAGTTYPVDRTELAHMLGFTSVCANSLDAVSDRDFALELLFAASTSMMHLSRFAEDVIFFNSSEARFIHLGDQVTSGSSLMPQKKNPDALELIRGKCGRVYGALHGLLVTLKALPMSYNKDLQEDKQPLFDAINQWYTCLLMTGEVIRAIEINKAHCEQAAKGDYTNATELADYLVSKGVPFRTAHHICGQIVVYALKQKKPVESLCLHELQQFSPCIEKDVYPVLMLEYLVDKRNIFGGTGRLPVSKMIVDYRRNFDSRDFIIRDAKLTDLDAISQLVNYWANEEENLPRSREELIHSIRDFAVVEANGQVHACASLYIYNTELSEIRSLGVSINARRKGYGKALVERMLLQAKDLALDKVLVLTRKPNFFIRLGFIVEKKANLPEKVLKGCELYQRQSNCDETALLYHLNKSIIHQNSANLI